MNALPIAHHEMYRITPDGVIHSGYSDKIIQPRQNNNGYLVVTLGGEQLLLHRLVAAHYIPNPYNHPHVNHKDGIKTNNTSINLEWCTPTQNAQHALKVGLRSGFVHVDVKRAMLHRALAGELVSDLALEVGNHPNTLNRMLRVQAQKDGLDTEWDQEVKRKRKRTALRNLEKINA